MADPSTLRGVLAPARRHVITAASSSIAATILTGVLVILAFGAVGAGFPLLAATGWAMAAVVLARAALAGGLPLLEARAAGAVRSSLQTSIYRFLLEAGPAVTDRRQTGELVSLATEAVDRVAALVARFLPLAARGAVAPIVLAVMAMTVDLPTGIVMLGSFLLVPPALRHLDKSFRGAGERLRSAQDTLAADFLDAVQGLETLVLFGADRRWSERLAERAEEVRSDTMDVLAVAQRSLVVVDYVYSLASVVGMGSFLLWRAGSGAVEWHEAALLVLLSVVAISALVDVVSFFYVGGLGLAALERIRQLMATPAPQAGRRRPGTNPVGGVRLDGVTYTYPDASAPAVADVTLYFAPGESVALVGRSGSGKSTLASLIRGRRRPQQGTITIDGEDIASVDPGWLASRVGYVGQDTHVFAATVADNLRMARPDATPEQMETACRQARILDVIRALPDGFASVIGERGATLSGGEAQRLGLARAFLSDPPILVVDEATSALDLETESLVHDAIEELMVGRTTIVIAHRVTTARRCDRVVQVEDGRLVATGAPSQMEGFFRRMRGGHR